MTITITKWKLALAILGIAMIAPATALATHVFDDVPDDAFYAEPVEWAADNSITTGKSPTQFAPLDQVTRGESVTFLKRYDDNIVQPALATLTADVADNAADIVTNTAALSTVTSDVAANATAIGGKADAGHDHDASYIAEVLSAGTATGGNTFTPEGTRLSESFTTTIPGRLHITVSYLFGISCTPTDTTVRYFYLVLDGVPIESSIAVPPSNSTTTPITFAGTTPDEISAGNHTVEIGYECFGSNTAGVTTSNTNAIYDIIVLPS